MTDDRSTFETTKSRLEDIVVQVRRKDVSLEQSLDMLEEAVRLVNQCNDLIDQTSWRAPVDESAETTVAGSDAESAPGEAEPVDAIDTDPDGAEEPVAEVVAAETDGPDGSDDGAESESDADRSDLPDDDRE